MMPVDPSLWIDGQLAVYGPSGMSSYGNMPDKLLDWTQDVESLNGGTPAVHDLRWRVAEFRSEVPSWDEAKECLASEIRKVFPGISLPTVADAEVLVQVIEWSADPKVRTAIEQGSTTWPSLLSSEILHRSNESWSDLPHSRILSFLTEASPDIGELTQAAIPGCLGVVIRWTARGAPMRVVRLNPDTLHLEICEFQMDKRTNEPYESFKADIVSSPFVVRRFEDEKGNDWYEWLRKTQLEGEDKIVRCSREDLIDLVRSSYRPSSEMMRGLAAWLERLPPSGTVSTRLALMGPSNKAGIHIGWWVPAVFGRLVEDRSNAAGILARWYRPRSAELAMDRFRALLSFATTPKLQAILCYVAGAPLFAKLAPSRPLPYLELVGMSGAGKTHTTRAAIAVLWGLGDGHREYIGGDAIHSGFRRTDFLSATDLPVLVDETSLTRTEREHMRAAANGSLTSRGGTDLLHRSYSPTAPVIFTCNASPDDSDSSSAERRGDSRRRIRIHFDAADTQALSESYAEFTSWIASLPGGPTALPGEGGGAALYRLNTLYRETGSDLVGIVRDAKDEQDAVLTLGAAILGVQPPKISADVSDHAGEAFLEWLRVEVGRYVDIRVSASSSRWGGKSDPIVQRIRPVDKRGDVPDLAEYVSVVYVTSAALEEYKAYRHRLGSSSPYHRLCDLASLAPLTGQTPKDMVGAADPGRPAPRGHLVRVNGLPVRAAKIALPVVQDDDGAKRPTLEEVGPNLT